MTDLYGAFLAVTLVNYLLYIATFYMYTYMYLYRNFYHNMKCMYVYTSILFMYTMYMYMYIHVNQLHVNHSSGFGCPWWFHSPPPPHGPGYEWRMLRPSYPRSGWWVVLMSQDHKDYDSPWVFRAEWCARQLMCIPYWWGLTSSKQPLSRDRWLVWPHHDSIYIYIFKPT